MKLGVAHDPDADGALIPLETPEYAERAAHRRSSSCPELYDLLDQVRDPELPELSIWDLGVLRDVCVGGGEVRVTITPTYSGCPALGVIREDIAACLAAAGHARHRIEERTAPAWSTAWLSRAAHGQLRQGGVAPPVAEPRSSWQPAGVALRAPLTGSGAVGVAADAHQAALDPPAVVPCPRCGSRATTLVSVFASTACKAHYRCDACLEPFDHFKAHL